MQIERYQQVYSAIDFIRDKGLFEEFAVAKLLFEEEKNKSWIGEKKDIKKLKNNMKKYTKEYEALKKQKKRAYMKKYLEKYYLEVLKPKRNKKSAQSNVIDKPNTNEKGQ